MDPPHLLRMAITPHCTLLLSIVGSECHAPQDPFSSCSNEGPRSKAPAQTPLRAGQAVTLLHHRQAIGPPEATRITSVSYKKVCITEIHSPAY